MVKRYYRSIFDELEDMRKYLDALNRQMYGSLPAQLLPALGEPEVKMLPAQRARTPVEVSDKDGEMVVTIIMPAGTTKNDIILDLINPRVLEITTQRVEERTDENAEHYVHTYTSGSLTRLVRLPKPVTDRGSSATFRSGRLEVHLKKTQKESRGNISID